MTGQFVARLGRLDLLPNFHVGRGSTRLVFPLSVFILALSGKVEAQFAYTNANGAAIVTSYTGPGGDVVIPESMGGLPVVGVADYTFRWCTNLTGVIIPQGVTNLGDGAFLFCTNLASVSFPSTLRHIGMNAFSPCHSLKSVQIPQAVTSIGGGAFSGCASLTSVSIPAGVSNIEGFMFAECTALTNVTIPSGATNIGDNAFWWCTSMARLTIPERVTTIGVTAFQYCLSLTSITLPKSLTNIADQAFAYCPLTSVFFEGNAPTAGQLVFVNCANPTIYYLLGTVGWSSTFAGQPTVLWNPQVQTGDPSFGIGPNGFGFGIVGTPDIPLVVEGCTNLSTGSWVSLQRCTLTNGLIYFSDSPWTNHVLRFYRLRSP